MRKIESRITKLDYCDSIKKEYIITAICSKRLMYLLQSRAEWDISKYTDLSESELMYIPELITDPLEGAYRKAYEDLIKKGERRESPSSAAFEINIDVSGFYLEDLFIFLTSFGKSEASELANKLLNTLMNKENVPKPMFINLF